MDEQTNVGNVGARKHMFYDREHKMSRQIYCPTIRINDAMVYICDDSTESGLIECATRKDALVVAKQIRREIMDHAEHEVSE